MAFDGTFPAPKLSPTEFGLFRVSEPNEARVTGMDEKWVRGVAQFLDSYPSAVTNLDITANTDEVIYSQTDPFDGTRYLSGLTPFYVEVTDDASTLGLNGEDRFARVLRQLEGVTQKAVEAELWDGAIAQGESLANPYLTGPTVTILNSGSALSPKRALALLEHKIGDASAAGEQGVIHVTRDVFSLLASNGQTFFHDKEKDHLQTMGGTPVVIGSGYSGNGPVSLGEGAPATDFSKWMYATGTVRVYLGEPDVVNDTYGQGYDVSGNKNDMKIKAVRPALAYFDTSIHLAVKVDLTTT